MGLINAAVVPFSHRAIIQWSHPSQLELPPGLQQEFSLGILGPSFRGDYYDNTLSSITAHSLYDDYFAPEQVKDIYEDLRDYMRESSVWSEEGKQVRELAEFFRVCVKNGLGVISYES